MSTSPVETTTQCMLLCLVLCQGQLRASKGLGIPIQEEQKSTSDIPQPKTCVTYIELHISWPTTHDVTVDATVCLSPTKRILIPRIPSRPP